jgi:hypothetical protein
METEPQSQVFICVVCSEDVDARMSAECNWCDNRYHLNPRNDIEAKDCGEVWIDDQYLALQFACHICLAGPAAGSRAATAPAEPSPRRRSPVERARRYRRRA